MNTRQIECFLEVGKLLNFTRAAQNLYLPQPAVSRYITALEKELGAELFIRESNRKVMLSEAGKAYYNMFNRFRMEYSNTRKLLSDENPILRLGYNIGWNISSFLPKVVANCRAAHPDFRISFECLDFQELITALAQKRLDAIITIENYPSQEYQFDMERITSMQRTIVYSDLLEGKDEIKSPADFYPYDFYIVDDARIQQLCRDVEDIFRPYHFVPRFNTVANMETVFAFIENGLGVALLDPWCQNLHNPGIHAMSIDAFFPISLVWRKNEDIAGVQILKEELIRYLSVNENRPRSGL